MDLPGGRNARGGKRGWGEVGAGGSLRLNSKKMLADFASYTLVQLRVIT